MSILKYALAFLLVAASLLFFFLPEPEKQQVIAAEPVEKVKYISAIQSVLSQYDSIMKDDVDSTHTVGAAIAVVYNNRIDFLKCYGVKKEGSRDSVNQNTIFRLASVSKTVSGTLAGILHNEKLVGLDDTISSIIPDFQLKTAANTNTLTIRHILSHSSGLVPHAFDNLIEDGVSYKAIFDQLQNADISAKPGELYGYQNVIFSIFDTVSFLKTGKQIGELFEEKLFTPCKMHTASTGYKAFKKNKNKAHPHSRYYGGYKKTALNNRYYNTIPAAGVNASISDMANFLQCILSNDTAVFKDNVLDTIFSPQIKTPLRRAYLSRWGKTQSKHYAVGWRIIGYRDRTIAYHGGYVQGYRTEIALCRDENIGIVYLSNSPSRTASIAVPTFLNLFFDYSDIKKTAYETDTASIAD